MATAGEADCSLASKCMDFCQALASQGLPFLLLHRYNLCLAPGVQGEGEVGAHVEGEVKGESLAGQCLAKVHALGGQGTVSFTRGGHFILLLNYRNAEA